MAFALFLFGVAGCEDECAVASGACGNGALDPGEQCDGPLLNGETCQSLDQGEGILTCKTNCTFDFTGCHLPGESDAVVRGSCGDGARDPGEQCDGTDLPPVTCADFGHGAGTISCTAKCELDLSECGGKGCGDGWVDPGEECDGKNVLGLTCFDLGFQGGTLGCHSDCTFDTSDCCQANCVGKFCGSDGCGGTCGSCEDGFLCIGHECVAKGQGQDCEAACQGPQCGSVGNCFCGSCPGCSWCNDGVCQNGCSPCQSCIDETCQPQHHVSTGCHAGDLYWQDSCGSWEDLHSECPAGTECMGSACVPVGECKPGETSPCEKCGTRKCDTSGEWGTCTNQGECIPGQQQSDSCGQCGTTARICTQGCEWSQWSQCAESGECSPGSQQSEECGKCGEYHHVCISDCHWGPWSDCAGQGDCSPGQQKWEPCGSCGSKLAVCNGSCSWEYADGCSGGVCEPGEEKECQTSGGCWGTMTCAAGCVYGPCEADYKNACGGCAELEHEPGTVCGLDIPTMGEQGCWHCSGNDEVFCDGEYCSACLAGFWAAKQLGCGALLLGIDTVGCAIFGLPSGFTACGVLLFVTLELVGDPLCDMVANGLVPSEQACSTLKYCPVEPCKKK